VVHNREGLDSNTRPLVFPPRRDDESGECSTKCTPVATQNSPARVGLLQSTWRCLHFKRVNVTEARDGPQVKKWQGSGSGSGSGDREPNTTGDSCNNGEYRNSDTNISQLAGCAGEERSWIVLCNPMVCDILSLPDLTCSVVNEDDLALWLHASLVALPTLHSGLECARHQEAAQDTGIAIAPSSLPCNSEQLHAIFLPDFLHLHTRHKVTCIDQLYMYEVRWQYETQTDVWTTYTVSTCNYLTRKYAEMRNGSEPTAALLLDGTY
jgi:hypothetical protein